MSERRDSSKATSAVFSHLPTRCCSRFACFRDKLRRKQSTDSTQEGRLRKSKRMMVRSLLRVDPMRNAELKSTATSESGVERWESLNASMPSLRTATNSVEISCVVPGRVHWRAAHQSMSASTQRSRVPTFPQLVCALSQSHTGDTENLVLTVQPWV